MEYLDNQHRILKYLCKLEHGIGEAHLKCLKDTRKNIATLQKIKDGGKEKHTCCDSDIDLNKLKSVFAERKTISEDDFDIALKALISNGYLTKYNLLTETGEEKNKEVFNIYYNTPEFIEQLKEQDQTLETATLLFKDLTYGMDSRRKI